MKLLRCILLELFLFAVQSCLIIHAQKVRSEGSSIHINNIKTEEKALPDTEPPVIDIISPDFGNEEKFITELPEITIIGKLIDEESSIKKILINSQECELDDDGLFIQKILLEKGDNHVNIIALIMRIIILRKTW